MRFVTLRVLTVGTSFVHLAAMFIRVSCKQLGYIYRIPVAGFSDRFFFSLALDEWL